MSSSVIDHVRVASDYCNGTTHTVGPMMARQW